MLLDSTTLLTRRHLCTDARDGAWEFAYPVACVGGAEELEPDDVLLYRHGVAPAAALTVTSGDSGGEGTSSGVRVPASEVPSAAELGGSGAVVGASAAELGGSGAVVGARIKGHTAEWSRLRRDRLPSALNAPRHSRHCSVRAATLLSCLSTSAGREAGRCLTWPRTCIRPAPYRAGGHC